MKSIATLLAAFLFTTALSADDNSFRVPPKEPSEALKTFKLQPGFRIELVAAEPLIRDPVAIDFDELGRMYVVEYPEFNEYSFGQKPKPSGAIKLLEDTNGDGRFDKATKFLDKVAFPTAVICYGGGVFVGAAPDLLYCKDTDGDGRADIRKKVLTGFARDFAGGGLLNSFRWGLDNRIHIATSFAGGNVRRADRPDDEPVSVRSRGVILDPRAGEFRLTSGGGQHGMGIDDWGRKFLCSNVNPMQLLMYDSRYLARNPFFAPPAAAVNINGEGRLVKLHRISPLEPWRIERSRMVATTRPNDEGSKPGGLFTSSSGITIYRGDAWPKAYRGNLFVGEVTNNLVYRAKLEPDGVGLVARRPQLGNRLKQEFLASTDIWFRPVQLANAPDGSLYVVDMYRELIEGAAFVPERVLAKLDPSSGTDRGRIYRVVADNSTVADSDTPRKKVNLAKRSTDELVATLKHANGWHRDTAARLLYERQDRLAALALRRLLDGRGSQREPNVVTAERAITVAHAMHTLDGLGQLTSTDVLMRLDDAYAEVRVHALKLAEPFVNDSPELRAKLYSMVDDDSPRVRYQLAFSLGAIAPNAFRSAALAQLLVKDAGNQWMRTAVQSSLAEGAGDMLLRLTANSKWRSSDGVKRMLQSLAMQIGAQGRSSEIALLVKALASIPEKDEDVKQAIMRGLFSRANGVGRQKLLAVASGKLDELMSDLVDDARATAVDDNADVKERVDAIQTLVVADFKAAKLESLFIKLLHLQQPAPVQSAAIRTLANYDNETIPSLLIKQWSTFSPTLRSQALETLLTRTDWTIATLEAIAKKQISQGDIRRSRLKLLKDHKDARIQKAAAELLRTPTRKRQDVVAAYKPALKMKGDIARGKAIFKKNCSACHRDPTIGSATSSANGDRPITRSIGADLSTIGSRPAEALLIDILDPSRNMKPKFANFIAVTNEGRSVSGMIVEETANSIRFARADGTNVTVLRIDIESLRGSSSSFMPEGLEKQIDHQAMADLLAHLAQFK